MEEGGEPMSDATVSVNGRLNYFIKLREPIDKFVRRDGECEMSERDERVSM
jgi:hypothetical protein